MTTFPLELDHVTRVFGSAEHPVSALCDVSLAVSPGELVAVMGPSGSGKSTLLNIAGLLQRPTSGRVLINGQDTSQMSDTKLAQLRRRHVGVVFQRFNLVPTLTVGENIALPLEFDGFNPKDVREDIEKALTEVGIEGTIDRFPEEISGGQAQRVAIARALIGTRSLILADEPTGALDTNTGDKVMRILRERINKESGTTGILVTHEPRFASFADRVLYVRDGHLTEAR